MSSGAPNKVLAARASAVLTTGEVAAVDLDLNEGYAAKLSCQIGFTLGMLTNGIFRFYVSMDKSTYVPIADIGGNVSYTLTADTTRSVLIEAPGWKFFRASVQGTGTVTNSLAVLNYRFLRRGTQV